MSNNVLNRIVITYIWPLFSTLRIHSKHCHTWFENEPLLKGKVWINKLNSLLLVGCKTFVVGWTSTKKDFKNRDNLRTST